MENDLTVLPWRSGQLHIVENYWEAAGSAGEAYSVRFVAALRRSLFGDPWRTPQSQRGHSTTLKVDSLQPRALSFLAATCAIENELDLLTNSFPVIGVAP